MHATSGHTMIFWTIIEQTGWPPKPLGTVIPMPIQQPTINTAYAQFMHTSIANITIFSAGMLLKYMTVSNCFNVFLDHAEMKQLSVDPATIPARY